ncbi:ralBP1-associated Eps domain-containing protein 1-like isoform X4 [Mytilus californianus]|uniref:ralBP1-associated Eps domain-containing protein 1-like isoform X4 n=1 Tax=Mytilus californianus TaxID=6549 RepID=UPI002245BB81|nr:ralBP1-associated Eps domain-containing protein 1-like isoform X4 [Mytilus californianus]
MEGLKLSQQEQRNYGELFQLCDVDGTGRITGIKASELFLSSGLGQDALLQISELCGAKRLGHFGRSQFYIALKLIAAAQQGMPLKLDSLNSGKEMPLPKFTRLPEQENMGASYNSQTDGVPIERSGQAIPLQQHPPAGQLPPPPVTRKTHTRRDSGQQRALVDRDPGPPVPPGPLPAQQQTQQSVTQTHTREESPLNPRSPTQKTSPPPPSSPPTHQPSIPTVSITNQVNPQKPTQGTAPHHGSFNSINSTHEVGWASFEDEESHGLLGTGPKKYNLEPPGFDSSSISSDPESVDDVWAISDEQKEYYIKQFQSMQPDLNGVIIGGVAKEFFEKSKLPVRELSQIWNLADINKDGALSLEEFCIAMHLVVLRRHEIELPERLPLSLMPYTAFTDEEPFSTDLPKGSTLKRANSPQSTSPQAQQQWAQSLIQESPRVPSDMSSPNQPVQFDFSKPVPSDPEAVIVHPVPMRASPETLKKDEPAPLVDTSIPVQSSPSPPASVETRNLGPSPIPNRPAPVPGTVTGLLIPVQASSQADGMGPEEPPAPPPRPPQQHGRSLSVDLQGLSQPPAVPPRASPKDSPAVKRGNMTFSAIGSEKINKFNKFEPIPSQEALNTMVPAEVNNRLSQSDGLDKHRRAYSLDYNNLGPSKSVGAEAGDASLVIPGSSDTQAISPTVTWDVPEDQEEGAGEKQKLPYRQVSRDKKDLQMAIRTHKERNSMLERLSSELNQELQEVMEQRIALEIQLEHLRPVYS